MRTIDNAQENLHQFLETGTQTELAIGPEGSLPFCELA